MTPSPYGSRERIIKALCLKHGISTSEAHQFLALFLKEIQATLDKDDFIKFMMFGVFQMVHKKARMGRNPRTLVKAVIHARKVLKFRLAKTARIKIQHMTS